MFIVCIVTTVCVLFVHISLQVLLNRPVAAKLMLLSCVTSRFLCHVKTRLCVHYLSKTVKLNEVQAQEFDANFIVYIY
jgi:hypothetical protein